MQGRVNLSQRSHSSVASENKQKYNASRALDYNAVLRRDNVFHNPYAMEIMAAVLLTVPSAKYAGNKNSFNLFWRSAQPGFFRVRSFSTRFNLDAPGSPSLRWMGFLELRRQQNAAHAADAVQRGVRCAKAGNYSTAMKHYAYALHIDVSQ